MNFNSSVRILSTPVFLISLSLSLSLSTYANDTPDQPPHHGAGFLHAAHGALCDRLKQTNFVFETRERERERERERNRSRIGGAQEEIIRKNGGGGEKREEEEEERHKVMSQRAIKNKQTCTHLSESKWKQDASTLSANKFPCSIFLVIPIRLA